MKLKDRIAEMNPDACIYLGCKNGSGFFFIGTPAEFNEFIDTIDTRITSSYQAALSTAMKAIEKNIDDRDELQAAISQDLKFANEEWKDVKNEYLGAGDKPGSKCLTRIIKLEETHLDQLKEVKKKEEKVERLATTIKMQKEKAEARNELIRKWQPIAEREIVEEYEHTVDIPGPTLLVDGKIEGDYWLRKEIEPWMKEERKAKKEKVE